MQTHCHSFPKLIVYYMAGICGFGLRNIRTQAWREHWTSSQVRMGSSSFASPSWNVFYSKRVVYGLLAQPPSGALSIGPTPLRVDNIWNDHSATGSTYNSTGIYNDVIFICYLHSQLSFIRKVHKGNEEKECESDECFAVCRRVCDDSCKKL